MDLYSLTSSSILTIPIEQEKNVDEAIKHIIEAAWGVTSATSGKEKPDICEEESLENAKLTTMIAKKAARTTKQPNIECYKNNFYFG